MSLTIDGVWKTGVWATTVWADGVWHEGAPTPTPTPTPAPSGGKGDGGKARRINFPPTGLDWRSYQDVPKKVVAVIERVAERQVERPREEPEKKEELSVELAKEGVRLETRYLEYLAMERDAILNREISRIYTQMRQDEEYVLLLIASLQ